MATGSPDANEPAAKKKRRRRRRKKKLPIGAETADGAERSSEAGDEAPAGEADDELVRADDEDGPDRSDRQRPGARRPPAERPPFNAGDEVFGRVSKITDAAIFVDVAGGKAVGIYDRAQLHEVPPLVGQQWIAKVKSYSLRGGALMLGPEPWDPAQTKLELRAAQETQNPIECWVTGIVRGGLEVDYHGVRAFAPASHVDLHPGSDITSLLGEKLPFVVAHYGKKGRDVVLSRKSMLEKEQLEKRQAELAKLQEALGADAALTVKAVVRNLVSWGAFAALPDYGEIEGVIHMSEVSHDRGARMTSVLSPGQEVAVKVLRIDEKGKLWLSHKATIEDPWARVREKYAVGSIHRGKVARLTDFGAFIQLEPGVDGLCHVSDLSFEPVEHPSKVVSEGADIEVIVAAVDSDKHKVALHAAPPADERELGRVKIGLHARLKVQVKRISDGGLGVRIVGATGRACRGFIPAGQTGTPRGTDLRKSFPLGTLLEAKVIDLDRRSGEARLSIRALKEDDEKTAYREYRKKVQREANFGTFGDLLKKNLGR